MGGSRLPRRAGFGVLDGSGNAPSCSPKTGNGHEKNERFNISPKPDPRGIKRRRIYTSILIAVFAAFTLSFGLLWSNKSSREGSDAPKPVLESKRRLPGPNTRRNRRQFLGLGLLQKRLWNTRAKLVPD